MERLGKHLSGKEKQPDDPKEQGEVHIGIGGIKPEIPEKKPKENKEQLEILKRKLEDIQKASKKRKEELEEAIDREEQARNTAADLSELEKGQGYTSIESTITILPLQIEELKKEEEDIQKQIEELER